MKYWGDRSDVCIPYLKPLAIVYGDNQKEIVLWFEKEKYGMDIPTI